MSIPLTLAVGMLAPSPSRGLVVQLVQLVARDVTGGGVAVAERGHLRLLRGTALDRDRASGPEAAARRRCDRAGDLALQPGALQASFRVGVRDRLEQCLRVRVTRIA